MGDSPTIRDVAKAARVAIGTVSRVLNGHKSVSEDVRRRVLKAVEKLSYEPDRVAQSMRLGVTRTVACATRDISIPGIRQHRQRGRRRAAQLRLYAAAGDHR